MPPISTGASEILPNHLWMGGLQAFCEVAVDLWVHCAYELRPDGVENTVPRFLWVRLDDSRALTPKELVAAKQAAYEAAGAIRSGQRVLISCSMGINRSGLVAGLALKYLGWSGAAAIELLRLRRSPKVLAREEYVTILLQEGI